MLGAADRKTLICCEVGRQNLRVGITTEAFGPRAMRWPCCTFPGSHARHASRVSLSYSASMLYSTTGTDIPYLSGRGPAPNRRCRNSFYSTLVIRTCKCAIHSPLPSKFHFGRRSLCTKLLVVVAGLSSSKLQISSTNRDPAILRIHVS